MHQFLQFGPSSDMGLAFLVSLPFRVFLPNGGMPYLVSEWQS